MAAFLTSAGGVSGAAVVAAVLVAHVVARVVVADADAVVAVAATRPVRRTLSAVPDVPGLGPVELDEDLEDVVHVPLAKPG
jgi:hypothetical protein